MAVIVIEIPALPPREASPNWRGHWAARYRAMTDYKTMTTLIARQARPAQPLPSATIRPTLVVPNRWHILDPDNAIASLKSAIDGLQSAAIIANDRDITMLPVIYRIGRTFERKTILEIEATIPPNTIPPKATSSND